jgi:hypothetical protein
MKIVKQKNWQISNLGMRNRADLMTRIAGFELTAAELGQVGVFLTLSCPSRRHAALSNTGETNPKYDGTTPREAKDYLNSQMGEATRQASSGRPQALRISSGRATARRYPALAFIAVCPPGAERIGVSVSAVTMRYRWMEMKRACKTTILTAITAPSALYLRTTAYILKAVASAFEA